MNDFIFGNPETGAPSILKCYIALTTLSFTSSKVLPGKSSEEVREDKLSAENAIGILSALVLGVSTTIFFNAKTDTALGKSAIGVSFISSMTLIASCQFTFLFSLLLSELNDDELVPFLNHLGILNRVSGILFIIGTVLWTTAMCLYLFDVTGFQDFMIILFSYFGLLPLIGYCAIRIMSLFYMTKFQVQHGILAPDPTYRSSNQKSLDTPLLPNS
jgi:hypothetical protein